MKGRLQHIKEPTKREKYRAFVSLLIIPLGMITVVRAAMVGIQAWTLIVLGLAFVVLGIVRLRSYAQSFPSSSKKRG